MIFFRIQTKGITLEQMKNHRSFLDNDPETDMDIYGSGVCACLKPDGTDGNLSTFGGVWDNCDSGNSEVIVFEGEQIDLLYDGYFVAPAREIARFSKTEWEQKINDKSAWNYLEPGQNRVYESESK